MLSVGCGRGYILDLNTRWVVCVESHVPPSFTAWEEPRGMRCTCMGGCWGPSSGLDVENRKYVASTGSRTCSFTIPTAVPAAVVTCVCFCTSCSTGSESLSTRPAHMFHYHTWKSWSIILAAARDVSFRPRPPVGVEIKSFFVNEINRWLSSQPKGVSVFVHGCYSCLHPG